MKVYRNLYPQVYDYGSLYWAYRNARKGKRNRAEVQQFENLLEDNLIELQNELIWKTYRQSPYREFYVHEPKKRLIMALPFRDRVVQWSIYMTINPILERKYIHDSYACRIGKGTHKALARVYGWLRHNPDLKYVLKLDIHKYFYRVNHDILLSLYAKFIKDDDLLWLLEHIIRANDGRLGVAEGSITYETRACGVGMAVGNLVSQMSANVYLNEVDQFVKHKLKVKYYARYMDDLLVLADNKCYLHEVKAEIQEFLLTHLALKTNNKTQIRPVRDGIEWVGFRVWPTHIKMRKSTAKRMKRRLKALMRKYQRGEMDWQAVNQSVQSYFGILKHCNSYGLRNAIWGPDGWFVLQRGETECFELYSWTFRSQISRNPRRRRRDLARSR